jgi:hypothetical protein
MMDAERYIEEELKRRGEKIERSELKYADTDLEGRTCVT